MCEFTVLAGTWVRNEKLFQKLFLKYSKKVNMTDMIGCKAKS